MILAFWNEPHKTGSFNQAAQEASMSRVYGGIHYRTGVDAGAKQGEEIANYIIEKLK